MTLEQFLKENDYLKKENANLKRTLFIIEKAILDFRLTQLENPITPEFVNAPHVRVEGEWEPAKEFAPVTPAPVEHKCSCGCQNKDEETEVINEEVAEPVATVVASGVTPVKKEKRQYKQRGGSVFTDFKTLTLDKENDFEGNSVVYSQKEEV